MSVRFAEIPAETVTLLFKRAVSLGYKRDKLHFQMDLSATHATCRLDLERLQAFDDFSFLHDVYGIDRHLDRETGRLTGMFRPRCAKPNKPRPRRTTQGVAA